MTGFPEQLEFLATIDDEELDLYGGRLEIESMMLKAAQASCDFSFTILQSMASLTGILEHQAFRS